MSDIDITELRRLAVAATTGEWQHMKGREIVRAIRGDLAVPLAEVLEPYSDPLLDAPTRRVGGDVVFRKNSQAARDSAAIRQANHNAAYIAAAQPATVLSLIEQIRSLQAERDALRKALEPFAAYPLSVRMDGSVAADEYQLTCRLDKDGQRLTITNGHLQAARSALSSMKDGSDG